MQNEGVVATTTSIGICHGPRRPTHPRAFPRRRGADSAAGLFSQLDVVVVVVSCLFDFIFLKKEHLN
jgi:hypothetical protein